MKRRIVFVKGGLLVVSIVTVSLWFTTSLARGAGGSVLATSSMEGCLDCASGSNAGCPEDYHVAWWEGSDPVWDSAGGSHPSTCWSGTCTSKHGLCELEGELTAMQLTELLDTAIRERHFEVVAEILATHPRQVSVNGSRAAVQVTGCSGRVVAHLPAPSVMMTSISATKGTIVAVPEPQ